MVYTIQSTLKYKLSTMITFENELIYNILIRRPFTPVGYYAFGIIIAIFYFEYT